jgi:thioredoxin-like negative regulator of GroEL
VADVFLSYARPDSATAEWVERELEKCGRSVWFDRELPAHRPYTDVIATELEASAAVLVLWSKDSVRSEWVRSEANRARELHKLVQVRLDEARLPMPFDQIQCADLIKWRRGRSHPGWSKVLRSIDSLAGGPFEPLSSKESSARWLQRRQVLLGSGVAALIAASGAAYWVRNSEDDHSNPESRLLLQKATDALQSDDSVLRAQAIPLLTQATQISPRFAAAWGALATAYATRKFTKPPSERAGDDARSRAAAHEALNLDSREPRALAALFILDPIYRNWLNAERDSQVMLKKDPRFPLLLASVADVLAEVGRWNEAVAYLTRIDRKHYLLPGGDRSLIIALWSAGQLAASDQALAQAVERWPDQAQIWRTRIAYLMYSGRSNEAQSVLDADRPAGITPDFVSASRACANALLGKLSVQDALERNLNLLQSDPSQALPVAQRCASLGDLNSVFRILGGYYFGMNPWSRLAPAGGDEDRLTNPLFQPPMKGVWKDPRFDALLKRIGLDDYWRASGTIPDFRQNRV